MPLMADMGSCALAPSSDLRETSTLILVGGIAAGVTGRGVVGWKRRLPRTPSWSRQTTRPVPRDMYVVRRSRCWKSVQ